MSTRSTVPASKRANSASEWNAYWSDAGSDAGKAGWYDVVARFYRRRIIRPALARVLLGAFPAGSRLLHAGCGGGEVDQDVVASMDVTAIDISPIAAAKYRHRYQDRTRVAVGSILAVPAAEASFDGVYNLGVMEHFSQADIDRILRECHRVLKPGGQVVLFWPPRFGLSVLALGIVHFILNSVLGRQIRLHPDEPSLLRSRRHATQVLGRAGFRSAAFHFGPRDAFTYAVVVGTK